MGTLRALLAITVVFAHSHGVLFVGARNAVQMFYVISGFLISYVLVEKKAYKTASSFYINRYLRLYPVYCAVALLSLLTLVFGTALQGKTDEIFFAVYRESPIAARVLLVFANFALFFQDWVMFAGVESSRLVFSTDFMKSDVPLWRGLLVPQAWTLGLELTFYLVAPFVLKRRAAILLLLFMSLALRAYLIAAGLGLKDPWTYRFFPTELALFLLGALAHQFLLPLFKKHISAKRLDSVALGATGLLIFIITAYPLVPLRESMRAALLFSIFLLLLPLLFLFQSRRKWDKWIGDLSYPVYICHVLIIYLIDMTFGSSRGIETAFLAVLLSVAFAIALNVLIANPIESLRTRFRVTPTST
jgi:peptidoglycan/LPS O-acetylase OafA/YrhL